MCAEYVHGYSERERIRLTDQADTLASLIHHDTLFEPGDLVLEAGCGVGAQTRTIASQNTHARIIAMDISPVSAQAARDSVHELGLNNVAFGVTDIFHLPFSNACFDHVFLCFVLEHLPNPVEAVQHLRRILKPGGRITVIEGDHGSVFFHPESDAARKAIACQVELQRRAGGNALIGRELYPLLDAAGFSDIAVSPRVAYADAGRPQWVQGFTQDTFTAMIEGVQDAALGADLISLEDWASGIRALYRTTEHDGTFSYTFFKATARL